MGDCSRGGTGHRAFDVLEYIGSRHFEFTAQQMADALEYQLRTSQNWLKVALEADWCSVRTSKEQHHQLLYTPLIKVTRRAS